MQMFVVKDQEDEITMEGCYFYHNVAVTGRHSEIVRVYDWERFLRLTEDQKLTVSFVGEEIVPYTISVRMIEGDSVRWKVPGPQISPQSLAKFWGIENPLPKV